MYVFCLDDIIFCFLRFSHYFIHYLFVALVFSVLDLGEPLRFMGFAHFARVGLSAPSPSRLRFHGVPLALVGSVATVVPLLSLSLRGAKIGAKKKSSSK
jgi:hypothetical protein